MAFFYELDELARGTSKQREAVAVLDELAIISRLQRYSPQLAGTIPLDVDILGSDLDIICETHDLNEFLTVAGKHYSMLEGYQTAEQISQGMPSVTVSFRWNGFQVELFAQPLPVVKQNAFRHMMVEARLLEFVGVEAKSSIRSLKEQGVATEPAFARYFNLSGDPYLRLLELEGADDSELIELIRHGLDWGVEPSNEKMRILEQTKEYVEEQLKHDFSGHDWSHISRVARTTARIATEEGANPFVCQLAALLHDLADDKLRDGEAAGLKQIRDWLESLQVDSATILQTIEIISSLSFKGGGRPPMSTIEGKVVQDADRLDALGAIGISRVFAYTGAVGRPVHDPEQAPRENMTAEEYRSSRGTAISHFYEKLLKLKDLMNTDTGHRLAEERHRFMEMYLEQFYEEWDGKR